MSPWWVGRRGRPRWVVGADCVCVCMQSHQHMEVASELESEQFRRRRVEASLEEQVQQVEALRSELAQQRPEGDGRERGEAEGRGEGEEDHTGSALESEVLLVKQSLCQLEAEKDTLASQLQMVVTEREALGRQVQLLSNERDSLVEQLQSAPPPAPADSHVTLERYQELASSFDTLQVSWLWCGCRQALDHLPHPPPCPTPLSAPARTAL